MTTAGDCALTETGGDADQCADCLIATCNYAPLTAQLYLTTLDHTGAFQLTPLERASETTLTGRIIVPPGPPPKI